MSDTILGGDFTVYYLAENRQKRIEYTGSGTTYTVNELYSALQDLFDDLAQMDDGTPMSAQTPTEYTIGIIDAGDSDPWFIDKTSVEYLTGGSLKSSSWVRVNGSNTGIVHIQCESTGFNFDAGDIGDDVTHSDGDAGTILDVNTSTYEVWIRPDDNTAGNDFDVSAGTLTATTSSNTCTPITGTAQNSDYEMLWANIYSIGTIEDNTHLYVNQNGSNVIAYKGTDNWWSDGHFDVLVAVRDLSGEVDEAVIQVFARQYSKTFDHFEVDLTSGGRNPIPLATADDLNNTTGYRYLECSGGGGTFVEDELIGNKSAVGDATVKAVITSVGGTGADPDLDYYLVGDLTDFTTSATVYGYTSNASAAVDTVSNKSTSPSTISGVDIVHAANENFDVDEDGTTENYSIKIDCNENRLASVYEWSKYLTRRGETATENTDGLDGEFYLGSDKKIAYTGITGNIDEGAVVTQATSLAYGTVVAHNTTDDYLILRNSRGTFQNTFKVYQDFSASYVTGVTVTTKTPVKAAPYGTFAGGTWFTAPGVVLASVHSDDANSYQLTDDDGNVVTAPTKVTVTVGNSRYADRIVVFRLTGAGGDINKSEYNATVNSLGATSLQLTTNISAEAPGKTTGGVVRLVDDSAEQEYRMRYSSYSSDTFLLAGADSAENQASQYMDAGSGPATLEDDGMFGSNKIGDLVYNHTRSAVSYIASIVNSTTVLISPTISGQTNGDLYRINVCPVLTTATDTVYVPFIDVYETDGTDGAPGSESALVTYSSDIQVRIRARNAGDILPYEADSAISNTGMSNNIIRTSDTIYSG